MERKEQQRINNECEKLRSRIYHTGLDLYNAQFCCEYGPEPLDFCYLDRDRAKASLKKILDEYNPKCTGGIAANLLSVQK